jgi:hypothetical protein
MQFYDVDAAKVPRDAQVSVKRAEVDQNTRDIADGAGNLL